MNNDLISRSAVKNIAAKYGAAEDFDSLIDEIPAVDAVEVVQCRDCKYNEPITAPQGYMYCSRWDICTVDNGFCHMGAKMDGDKDAVD